MEVCRGIKRTVEMVYSFFIKIMDGLPNTPTLEQNLWCAALVNFLQKSCVSVPYFMA